MRIIPAPDPSLPLLLNGKPHVSFSEVSTWRACPWRHKLVYIEKIGNDDISPYLDYGTIVHDAAEGFLKTKKINLPDVHEKIRVAWKLHGFDTEEFIVAMTARAKSQNWKYKHVNLDGWLMSATNALTQLPSFMDETFPGWIPVASEYYLYENIEGKHDGQFKGFIDCVIELSNGKHVVIDWKTAGPRGWNKDKQRDFLTQAQIVLYKHYWMKVTGKASKDVQTAFVLLKRDSKPGKSVAIVKVSAGPIAIKKALKYVEATLKFMKSGWTLKNRQSCKFCEFYQTPSCT